MAKKVIFSEMILMIWGNRKIYKYKDLAGSGLGMVSRNEERYTTIVPETRSA